MQAVSLSPTPSALHTDSHPINSYETVPDGLYWTEVEDVTLVTNPRIALKLRILGPGHCGCQLQHVLVITPETLRWLERDLHVREIAARSLIDPSCGLENLCNVKLRVAKEGKSVHILDADAPAQGNLFLHLIDREGNEYLDQHVPPSQHPKNQQELEAVVHYFVKRYYCPRPFKAYLEDGGTGAVLLSTDQP